MSIDSASYHWIFKYKLYHLPFWFLYHYIWWSIAIGSIWEVTTIIFFSHAIIKFTFYLVFQALGVYFNLYYLIPRFLEKGRYVIYLFLLFVTIISTALCIVTGYYLSAWLLDRPFQELWGVDPANFLHFFKVNSLPSTVASMTLAMSIKLTKNWIQAKRREKLLEKEKLETELKFLKSQFNPHFLFNTINSIFVLIHKNQHMASEALAKFSDLLRYQLYECNEQEILLKQELTYLKNYIELEKLRCNTDNLKLNFSLDQDNIPNVSIAPFVLIPFIENAFKHVSQHKDQLNWIKMDLQVSHHQLHFFIANSSSTPKITSRSVMGYSGIGLKNVQRRLNLIYHNEHELTIDQTEDQFSVSLSLTLHEQKVAEPIAITIES